MVFIAVAKTVEFQELLAWTNSYAIIQGSNFRLMRVSIKIQ